MSETPKNLDSLESSPQLAQSPEAIKDSVLAELSELGNVPAETLKNISDGLANLEGAYLQQAVASIKDQINQTKFENQKIDLVAKQNMMGVLAGTQEEAAPTEDDLADWLSQA